MQAAALIGHTAHAMLRVLERAADLKSYRLRTLQVKQPAM